jgi:hypothetical protein
MNKSKMRRRRIKRRSRRRGLVQPTIVVGTRV